MSVQPIQPATQRRAIGIIRVSHTAGREGERFASPEEQRQRIETACERDGLTLVAVHEELDVSGGRSLANRPGLSQAVAAIEAGHADVVAAAYFDRLFRSLQTQAEVVERVEQAGGQVLAIDIGQVSNGSAGQWLSGVMMGAVSEYFRRSAKERTAEGVARAVARGAMPWPGVPLGYSRKDDGTLEPDEQTAPLVRRAFEMREAGISYKEIRAMLHKHGIERSFGSIPTITSGRVYLGEIHFGKLVNLRAHEPIVDRDLFARAQRMKAPRGRRPSSDYLLARLGVLRCGSCGVRMSTGRNSGGNRGRFYNCPSWSECEHHVRISADVVERIVADAVRSALQDAQGRASIAESAQEAVSAVSSAQEALDTALRVFTLTGAENESAAVDRLAELRQVRDDAQTRLDQIGPEASRIVTLGDWDALSLAGRRDLIRATVESVTIAPKVARSTNAIAERVSVRLIG